MNKVTIGILISNQFKILTIQFIVKFELFKELLKIPEQLLIMEVWIIIESYNSKTIKHIIYKIVTATDNKISNFYFILIKNYDHRYTYFFCTSSSVLSLQVLCNRNRTYPVR